MGDIKHREGRITSISYINLYVVKHHFWIRSFQKAKEQYTCLESMAKRAFNVLWPPGILPFYDKIPSDDTSSLSEMFIPTMPPFQQALMKISTANQCNNCFFQDDPVADSQEVLRLWPGEVGIYKRKQENTLSTKKTIKKKRQKHALDQESYQKKRKKTITTKKKKKANEPSTFLLSCFLL